MIISCDLNGIQPRYIQVWNCDGVGFDPNVMWHKVICVYKVFQGELKWKVQTAEQSPFWCTLIVFNQADGKCFIPPFIVHQSKEYYQYLYLNIPLDWIFHHTSSGYMYRYGWLKTMT